MKILRNIKNGFIYAITAIKNRYPCKIDTVHFFSGQKPSEIKYLVLNRVDARENDIHEIVLNPTLLEKFHPSDALKLGVILTGDIIFKNKTPLTSEELLEKYQRFCKEILENTPHDD